jgi:hypothetical protein
MTKADENENQAGASVSEPPSEATIEKPIVTLDDFNSLDFEAALEDGSQIDPHELSSQFQKLAKEAELSQHHAGVRVYGLLSAICNIHLRTDDRAEPWGPMASAQTWRSLIPSDLKGDQNTVLLSLLERIKNPGLKARLADITWSNDRRQGQAAAVAIEAYKACTEGLLNKTFKPAFEDQRSLRQPLFWSPGSIGTA